jgi:hypothetical protein
MTQQTTTSPEVAEVLARVIIRLVQDPFSAYSGASIRDLVKLSRAGVKERRQVEAYVNKLLLSKSKD